MVINLRGTGGSGKSTVVRRIMKQFTDILPAFVDKRKRPISYLCQDRSLGGKAPDLRVLGHYETPCGGCDTISSPDLIYQHVNAAVAIGENVLFEGIIIGDDVKRCVELARHTDVRVIALNTPMDVCLASIQSRRDDRGDARLLDPTNTKERAERLKRMVSRLKDAKVNVQWAAREEAYVLCLNLLGIE